MSSIGCLLPLVRTTWLCPATPLENSDNELSITHRLERSPDWIGDGSEGGVDIAGVCFEAPAGHQLYLRAYYYGIHRAHHERKKGLHRERAVDGGTGDDERAGNGVHLFNIQRVVEGLDEGDFAECGAHVRAVSGYCGEDPGGLCKVGVAHNGGRDSEVGANSDIWRDY